ncbi:hypothetical protein K432DRAFT_224232 [Lepidopterella palustris CBS 459.81]|uniref:Uncharacterized protein n=1 Tax=Lepidopterella palustris CBS 459.81 TaxID=1314670 RepID=A0A8E2EE44_9PEZI|nr:hypothetical protein K432DRAFT_224232 [Lepidopterella palustris CBS 459.81]
MRLILWSGAFKHEILPFPPHPSPPRKRPFVLQPSSAPFFSSLSSYLYILNKLSTFLL